MPNATRRQAGLTPRIRVAGRIDASGQILGDTVGSFTCNRFGEGLYSVQLDYSPDMNKTQFVVTPEFPAYIAAYPKEGATDTFTFRVTLDNYEVNRTFKFMALEWD